jgi:hypothetical protein
MHTLGDIDLGVGEGDGRLLCVSVCLRVGSRWRLWLGREAVLSVGFFDDEGLCVPIAGKKERPF